MSGPVRAAWLEPRQDVRAYLTVKVTADGDVVTPLNRSGRIKSNQVDLVAANRDATGQRPRGFSDADWAWVLAARSRRWPSVVGRFADRAPQVTLDLVAAGVVSVRVHPVGATFAWDTAQRWTLEPGPAAEANRRAQERQGRLGDLRMRAARLADLLDDEHRELASLLRDTPAHSPVLAVAVAAASDLNAGVTHDGPRAFSQTHFGHTKARDDAPELLRRAGVSEGTLRDLGLARSPYVGIGGAIDVNGLPLGAAFPGPVRLRATGHDPLDVRVNEGARALLLVENLQAAETACDMFPDVAVIWFAGQPADAVLAICVSAARQISGPILVAPDADLGGVRIANRLLAALPSRSRVHVVDAGVGTTAPTTVFANVSLDELERISQDADGPHASHLSAFARAVADRGYPVEQEASIRAALSIALLPGE